MSKISPSSFRKKTEIVVCHQRYGFHCHKFPSLYQTVQDKVKTPLTAMQIYISNGRSYTPPSIDNTDILKTRKLLQDTGMYLSIHGCLLYNPAGSAKGYDSVEFQRGLTNTRNGIISELDIGAGLGSGVVIHLGSFPDEEEGLKLISETCEWCLKTETPKIRELAKLLKIDVSHMKKQRRIILENSSGGGTKLGYNLQHLSRIIEGIPDEYRNQIRVCIDTAHSYGAGDYDWGIHGEIKRFYNDFERMIGLEYLELFHLNDSERSEKKANNAPFNSKKDRHTNLGKGYIFDENDEDRISCLKTFLNEAFRRKISVVQEPPARGDEGRSDWWYVAELMMDTDTPLISI